MRSVPTKTTGDSYSATEFNELTSQELQNVVLTSGQVLNSGDLNQLGKAAAIYSAAGDFYSDGGSANTYVLTPIGSPARQAPPTLINGLRVRFVAGNSNTGASTINLNAIGAVALTNNNIALIGNEIRAGAIIEATYNSAAAKFFLVSSSFSEVARTDNYTTLKAFDVAQLVEGQTINVDGRATSGDGGEGPFTATEVSPGADNDGTILHSDTAGWFFVRQGIVWFNVKWFGATGDDSTDDTTAIQNCIDATAASSTVNFGVLFPAGTYRVTSLIFKNASSADIYTFRSWGGAIIKGTAATGDVITVTSDRVHIADIDIAAHTTRVTSGNGITVTGDNCVLTRIKGTGHPGLGISVAGEGSIIDNCEGFENTGASEMQISGSGHTVISPTLTRVAATGLGTCLDMLGDQHTVIGGKYSNSNIGINCAGSACNILSPEFVGDGTTAMATGVNLTAASTNNTVSGLEASYTNVTNALVVSGSSSGNITTQDGLLSSDKGLELGSAGPTITSGTGSPEGVVTAPQGSKFYRTDGLPEYSKISGSGNTGWQPSAGLIKHPTEHLNISSGTTLDWTSIPADVSQIKIVFRNHSPAGGQDLAIRIGDSGGFETTGYSGRAVNTTAGTDWSTMAIMTNAMSAANVANGEFVLTLNNGTVWNINGTATIIGGTLDVANGSKGLTGVLTQVRLLMTGGTTFDGTDADYVLYYQ